MNYHSFNCHSSTESDANDGDKDAAEAIELPRQEIPLVHLQHSEVRRIARLQRLDKKTACLKKKEDEK